MPLGFLNRHPLARAHEFPRTPLEHVSAAGSRARVDIAVASKMHQVRAPIYVRE